MKFSTKLNKTSNFICQSGQFIASNADNSSNIFLKILIALSQNFSNGIKQFFIII